MASDKMLGSFDQKSAPEDNDLLVEYDAAASKVKNVKFGGVWNWIVKKLTSAVINELQTSSKNVVGAINELNSKTLSFKGIFASDMNYTEISPGIYNLQTESTYTNGISGASYCLFIQYNDKYKTQAVFHPTKGVMTRRYAGNPITWTDWV